MKSKKRVTPKGVTLKGTRPRDLFKKRSTRGKRGKNNFNLKKEYKQSWDYLKDSRNFIYSIIIIFFLFALIGFFVPISPELEKVIMDFLKELLEKTKDFNQWEMVEFLFLNNLQSSFFGLIFGVVLGIFPMFASVVNGYVLGFVALKSIETEGILVLWRLFPHGIFELPAVFISLGLGLKFGTFIFQKKKMNSFKNYFWNAFRVFIFVVIPLLIIAAIIETCLIFLIG